MSTLKKLILPTLVMSFSFLCYPPLFSNAHLLKICKFDQIYQLGDSISDTGNLIREFPIGASTAYARLPYGETFFKYPTGRCSNGLLMIDYIGMDAGVPFLPPYKNSDADFSHGVNFAVGGSTALSSDALAAEHNIYCQVTNSSLSVQLDWMSNYFNSFCHDNRDCGEKLRNALFMIGEVGGNDYNFGFLQGKTMEELRSMVPKVVDAIMAGVKKAISFGATRLVVPGNIPIGCIPFYQTAYETNILAAHDENQCLKELNDFAKYHNEKLQEAIHKLKLERPNAIIVYGDYYNAYKFLLKYAKYHGFDTERACCGTGGKYNFDSTRMCGGGPDVGVCPDPERYMNWDGVHLTQEAYRIMAAWLVHDIFPNLQCSEALATYSAVSFN